MKAALIAFLVVLCLVSNIYMSYAEPDPLAIRRTSTTQKPKKTTTTRPPTTKKVRNGGKAISTRRTTTTSTTATTSLDEDLEMPTDPPSTTSTSTPSTTTTTTHRTTTTTRPTTTTKQTKPTTTSPATFTAVLVMVKDKKKLVPGVEYDDLHVESSKLSRQSSGNKLNKKPVFAYQEPEHYVNVSTAAKSNKLSADSPPLTVAEATIVAVSIAIGALVLSGTCIYVLVATDRLKIQPEKRFRGSSIS